MKKIENYSDFYKYYLDEHKKRGTRILHAIGTLLFVISFPLVILLQKFWLLPIVLASPYLIAWFSHFFIEKNKPAAFDYFWWSLASDFKMTFQLLIGKLRWSGI